MKWSLVFAALITTVSALGIDRRQATGSRNPSDPVTFRPVFPYGPQNSNSSLDSTIPIECLEGCYQSAGTYISCFVLNTGPIPANQTECNQFLCQQTNYDALSACLNCIFANGNERPFGYYTNTAATADPSGIGAQANPNGLIDANESNGILKNVSDRCAGISSSVTGATTVTATPTTTGFFHTTWTSGATVVLPTWTGLTQFTSALSVIKETRIVYPTATISGFTYFADSSGGASASGSASPSSGSTTSPANAASGSSAPSSSASSGAEREFGLAAGALLGSGCWLAYLLS